MSLAIDRAAFLSADLKGRNHPVRPPWSISEMAFRSTCNSCGDCLEICPTNIIEFGRGRMPQINFDKGECLLCGDCLRACKPSALVDAKIPWDIKAYVDASSCLAFKGVECRSCQDYCESRAIRFIASVGKIAKPDVNTSNCNGCGACYANCPVRSIQIKPYLRG